jgi:ParB family chromosome partitioning protein
MIPNSVGSVPIREGYLDNPALLDQLVSEQLEKAAADILAEGWKWVELNKN